MSVAPDAETKRPHRFDWRINAALFLATVGAVFHNGAMSAGSTEAGHTWLSFLATGWTYAVPLLAILLFHEFGHYVAARLHGVPVSLPYFIPLPLLGFGTLGAVIAMPERIRSRNALLDIGAAGPLAGMAVAVPMILIGLTHSEVMTPPPLSIQEGQSVLYLLMKWIAVGPIPEGQDVMLHPTALAGWVGLFVTMLNLVPFGQLDGGHILYALIGDRHARWSHFARLAILGWGGVQLAYFVAPVLLGSSSMPLGQAVGNAMPWLVWSGLLALMTRLPDGAGHPPTDDGRLSPLRRTVGWACLALFFLLFMPTPIASY